MIQLGRWNDLTITRFTDHGAYVDGGETGEILMPRSYVKPEMRPGDEVHVFVYLDQEERLVATMEQPLAHLGCRYKGSRWPKWVSSRSCASPGSTSSVLSSTGDS